MVGRHLRLWWFLNGDAAKGLALTFALSALLLAGVWAIVAPAGPGRTATGEVSSVGMAESKTGSFRVAYVSVADLRGRVTLYPADRCAVGDAISLRVVPRWWGDYPARGPGRPICRRSDRPAAGSIRS